MAKEIRGYFIDVVNARCGERTVADDLDTYYQMLNCDCIEIVKRRIGKKDFQIICDESGTLKENFIVSAITWDGGAALVGNLFVTGLADDEGELTDLTDEDVKFIGSHVTLFTNVMTGRGTPMLIGLNG